MSGLQVLSAIFVLSLVQGSPVVKEETFPRLPLEVKPIHYEIRLTLDLEKDLKFEGKSSITFTIDKPIREITLHAKNLDIKSPVTVSNIPTEPKAINGTVSKSDEKTDFIKIKFDKEIPKNSNNLFLRLEYSGKINENKFGLYRSSYINNLGEKEWWAATQFEPIGARQVFPCFDEPAIKTTFSLSITCDKKYTVFSNTHETSSATSDINLKTTAFGITPQMSTYLLAFAIGKFDAKRGKTLPNLQVVALRDRVEHGSYALNYSEKVLQALNVWTEVPYTNDKMNKLDSVALPGMAEGGMENWGLITYREDGLFARQNYTSTAAKEGIVKLVAHEIAHQWFGNLVTCEWWDYAWLNEGFATYFQYIITDKVEPTWNVMHKMVVDSIQASAFVFDSKTTSHAMNMQLTSSEQIRPGFDTITYQKAGAIIRMIDHVLPKDQFQKAIRSYLSANKFKAVNPDVLFTELQKVMTSKENFVEILKNWVTTPGFPVVTVMRNYTTNKATISQSRFLYKKDDLEKTYYHVPINYVSEDKLNFDDTTPTAWLPASNKPLVIDNLPKDKFLLFNKQQFGYYRVNYDNETWKLITNFMLQNSSKIHVLNRAQLIDDSFNLARAGKLDYSVPLSLAKYLKEETDYIPWISAMNAASHVDRVLANSKSLREFKNFVVELMNKMVKSVGFEGKADDDHVTLDKRASAVRWACAFGSKSCVDYAKEKFNKWMADPKKNPLSADLRETILCSALHKASEITWADVFKKYHEENNKDLLPVLGCSSNENIISFYLEIAMNSSFSIDINQALKSVYSNSQEGRKIALEVLMANYSQIVTLNDGDKNAVGNHISAIASRMTTEAELTPLKEFIKKNEKDLAMEIIGKGVAVAEDNINWVKTHEEKFLKFFQEDKPQTPTTKPPPGNKPDSAVAFTVSTLAILGSLVISLL